MLRECDYSQALLEQVNQAISDKTPLVIQGSNSKAFLGRPVTGQTLDVRCHRGIVKLRPDRAGDNRACRNAAGGD